MWSMKEEWVKDLVDERGMSKRWSMKEEWVKDVVDERGMSKRCGRWERNE